MPGDALGQVPNRPGARPGGFALRINGAPQGVRDNVNFEDTPGVAWSGADDGGNNRVNVSAQLAAEVVLDRRADVQLITGFGGWTIIALSSLGVTLAQVTRVIFRLTAIAGFVSQPTVEVGTNAPGGPPWNDLALPQQLSLLAVGDVEEVILIPGVRPAIGSGATPTDTVVTLATVFAVATVYTVEVIVMGVPLVP